MATQRQRPEQPLRKYVKFHSPNGSFSRTLSSSDWKLLGAEGAPSGTTWDAGNGFRVLREEIPLEDWQLEEYLKQDRSLVLVEE